MVLTEQDIRSIVAEVITEVRHVISDSLEKLAKRVIKIAKIGGGKISAKYVNKVNPYFRTDKDLRVVVEPPHDDVLATFYKDESKIAVSSTALNYYGDILLSTVMHELSHYIDQTKRTKEATDICVNNSDGVKDRCTYLFNPSEMQARLVEYATQLKKDKNLINLKVEDDNTRLFITQMRKYLSLLRFAKFNPNTAREVKGKDVLEWVCAHGEVARAIRKLNTTDVSTLTKNSIICNNGFVNEADFLKRQQAVVKLYEKRLRNFTHKALKIKYDYINQQ
jgi:hypothetical protein